jgi:hypothetical protein
MDMLELFTIVVLADWNGFIEFAHVDDFLDAFLCDDNYLSCLGR